MKDDILKRKSDFREAELKALATVSQVYLSQGLTKSLLQTVGSLVFIVNDRRQIVWANDTFLEVFGYTLDELVTITFDKIIHYNDYKKIMVYYERDLKSSKDNTVYSPSFFIIRFKHKKGHYISFRQNMSKQIAVEGHLMVTAELLDGRDDNVEYTREETPSNIITRFWGKEKTSMTSEGEWWSMFDGMKLVDMAMNTKKTTLWGCILDVPNKVGKVIMDWHCHDEQTERITVQDGVLHIQEEKKRWWYKIFGINKDKITHFRDIYLNAYEQHIFKLGVWHRVLGHEGECQYTVMWNPKIKLVE